MAVPGRVFRIENPDLERLALGVEEFQGTANLDRVDGGEGGASRSPSFAGLDPNPEESPGLEFPEITPLARRGPER